MQASFLITIDTEGDNLWEPGQKITTRNALYLPRFQKLCESYGFKPTYLTNYEMAKSSEFKEFALDALSRKQCEIGMHLHAWNTPPLVPLTKNDYRFLPYLVDFPEKIMTEKVNVMTDLLESTFQLKMTSHRAGRWAFNEPYAKSLIENGYLVDCSVTPFVSWKDHIGDPKQHGGTDYRVFPAHAYFIDPDDISKPGVSSLLEVPVSIEKLCGPFADRMRNNFRMIAPVRKAINYLYPSVAWLRPHGNNQKSMLRLIQNAVNLKKDYIELIIHSSELMPGGSPSFRTEKSIEKLYCDLEMIFNSINRHFTGRSLTEYYNHFINKQNK